MRTFIRQDGRGRQFWTVEVHGSELTITSGNVGSPGKSRTKSFASEEKARREADKLVQQKTAAGYAETTPPVATREAVAFERALEDNPDDLAGWSAYADYLAEQGSLWGEFMRVQLALEDESRTGAERKKLKADEKKLLAKHERDWLGVLAPYLLDSPANEPYSDGYDPDLPSRPKTEHRWRRGVLDELTVDCVTVSLAHALADAPAARFLRKLRVLSTADYLGMEEGETPRRVPAPPRYHGHDEWPELFGAPWLGNLRIFQMGDINGEPPEDGWCSNHTYAPGLERLVACMTRIEELHLLCKDYDRAELFGLPSLKNLRVLRMYAPRERIGRGEYEIELDLLARNPLLGNLTHLMLHPHYAVHRSFIPLGRVVPVFRSPHLKSLVHLQLRLSDMGDQGVREIISSGILKRLKVLDLRHGCITDEGARLFAECADTRNLEHLDLTRNRVTPAGLNVLRKAGVKAVANKPLTDQELADHEYLHEGDFE